MLTAQGAGLQENLMLIFISFPKLYGTNFSFWDVVLKLMSLKYNVSCNSLECEQKAAGPLHGSCWSPEALAFSKLPNW